MILAAGLGTRMKPLTNLLAKPALPILGRPVIAWLLHFLRSHGIQEVAINLHHHAESIKAAVSEHGPHDQSIHYFYENKPLGTGGGIAAARDFLSQSDPSIVLAGDMLVEFDLAHLVEKHRQTQALCTLLLLKDPARAEAFGSIGLDPEGRVRRIANRLDLGDETENGLFVGLRIFSPGAFDALPKPQNEDAFEDLSDWLGPLLDQGRSHVCGQILDPENLLWRPIGTPGEYLDANLDPPAAPYLGPTPLSAPGTQRLGENRDVVIGAGARLGKNAELSRCVVWENENVPANFQGTEGVFAGGKFSSCRVHR